MKLVRQKHRTGCGLACVAMIAGISYKETFSFARHAFNWQKTESNFRTDSNDLRTLLSVLKIKTEKGRSVRKISSLSDKAIVAINYNEDRETWHWVVFLREKEKEYFLDPRTKKILRTDFTRMRLRSFIPVTGTK